MKNIVFFILLLIIAPLVIRGQEFFTIEKELLEEINTRDSGSNKIRVNIVLREQSEPVLLRSKSAVFQGREAKRRFVIDELKRFSGEAQQGLLNSIGGYIRSGDITDIKSFWITNAINCEASVEAIQQLATHPDVLLIGTDREEYVLFGGEEPDPSGNPRGMAYNITNVGADKVWEMGYTGEGIIVAVLDTGVNYNHDDIRDNMWKHPDYPYYGYDFVNGDNNPLDDKSHGTHCAGTVAGTGKSGTRTGIAPGASIMAVKVLSSSGSATSANICSGIEFAVEHGAHILSMSFGFVGGGTESQRIQFRDAMANVLEAGVIAAVAAGNEGDSYGQPKYPVPNNIRIPGSCPPPWINKDQTETGGTSAVICVGATDNRNERIAISSIGPVTWQNISGFADYAYNPGTGLIRPDICAPGDAIVSLSHTDNTGYLEMTGTSMATPCIAGVIALMLSKNPELTPAEVCEILEVTTDNTPPQKNNLTGSGKVNARKAIEAISDKVSIGISEPEVSEKTGNGDGKINPGETVTFSFQLENNGVAPLTDVLIRFKTDENVEIIQGELEYDAIEAGELLAIEDAFEIAIPSDFTKVRLRYQIEITTKQGKKISLYELSVFDYKLEVAGIKLNKATNAREILIFIENNGNETAHDIYAILSTTASGATVEAGTSFYGNFNPGQYKYRAFTTFIGESVTGTTIPFNLHFTDKNGRATDLPFLLKMQHTSVPVMCECPLSIVHEIGQEHIQISWEVPGNNTPQKFAVYKNGSFLAETVLNTFLDADLTGGETLYSIEALFEGGCTSNKTDYEILIPCAVPAGFKAEAISEYRIKLTWNTTGKGVSYNVFRDSDLLQSGIEELVYIDADVTEGQTYCYTVTTSCNEDMDSDHSELVCETPEYVNIQDVKNPVKIYPNPTKGQLWITNYESQIKNIQLFDLSGRLLYQKDNINAAECTMDISGFAYGLYILKVDGKSVKLIKQ